MENKKIFLKWWFIAALIYLIFSAIVTWQYGTNFLMPLNDDTAHYIQLAKNLISYGIYSLDGLDGKYSAIPPHPTNFLAPGYAFWLVFIYIIFKSFAPAIFIGVLIFAFSVPLTYFLAKEIAGNEKIAFWSALIFMVEPLSIYHSGLLFTEQVFIPLFLGGIYYFIKYVKSGGLKPLSVSFVALSAATLVRPVIFYLLPFLVLIVVFKELKISWRRAAVLGALSIFLAYSISGAWIIRNKIVLNTWQVSSGDIGAILFGYHYEPLMRHLGLKPESQKILCGGRDIFSVECNKISGDFAVKEILKHKAQYLKLRLAYAPLFFLSNGYDNILSRLTSAAGFDKYFRGDLVSSFLKNDFNSGFKMLFSAPKSIILLLIGSLVWFLVLVLAIAGFKILYEESENKMIIIFIVFVIMYFTFVMTPLITARYRLPLNPLIFIFAVSGFYFLKDKLKQWT